MRYKSAEEWIESKNKRVLLFGMSGVGKTHLSNILRASKQWFHYSVDYRIGTRYMGEHIVDNFKREAMRNAFLAEHLLSDSIYIASKITFNNLTPLSTYIGKPGNLERGGLAIGEYIRRQKLHHDAEVAALLDSRQFIKKATEIYRYPHFVCDSGGSICEIVEPDEPNDRILRKLSDEMLLVWIKSGSDLLAKLMQRFHMSPKPMYYQPEFLEENWQAYRHENAVSEGDVDPNDFARWIYARAVDHRQPRYAEIARNWGVSIDACELSQVGSARDFNMLVARTLDAR